MAVLEIAVVELGVGSRGKAPYRLRCTLAEPCSTERTKARLALISVRLKIAGVALGVARGALVRRAGKVRLKIRVAVDLIGERDQPLDFVAEGLLEGLERNGR